MIVRNKPVVSGLTFGAFVILFLLIFGGSAAVQYATINKGVQFTVNSLERVVTQDSSKYMVFTELDDGNVEVFENRDSLPMFKWNSSDIQAKLKPGKKYTATVTGWRIQFLSMYRNIVSVEEVNE